MSNVTYDLVREYWGVELDSPLSRMNFENASEWARISGISIDWLKPKGLNDLINWLKVFDLQPSKIPWSNKYTAKNIVANLPIPDLQVAETVLFVPAVEDLLGKSFPFPTLIKVVSDSGSVTLLDPNQCVGKAHIGAFNAAESIYGVNKGEWPYQFAGFGLLVEEQVGDGMLNDIKLHCYDGKVIFIQQVWDRGDNTKEALLTRCGRLLDFGLNHENKLNDSPPRFGNLHRLVELAEFLARPFKYVRVDLYEHDDCVFFGELTFFPMAGCFKGVGEQLVGQMMPMDNLRPRLGEEFL